MTVGDAGVNEVKEATFSTRSQLTTSSIVVKMIGNADSVVHDRFKAFLDELSEAAGKLRVREAVFDLEELYFMNSSCMALFLRMVKSVLELPADKYAIRFRSNPNLRWQKRSLNSMRMYAPDIVVIE
jgi:anti-anti-sigma factor